MAKKEKILIHNAWLECGENNETLVFFKSTELSPKCLLANLGNTSGYTAQDQIALMNEALELNNMAIKPLEKLEKNNKIVRDGRKLTLKLASEGDIPQGYNLFLKGTDKFIYRINNEGIFVTNSAKTRKVIFSKRDIGFIENIDEFDIVKADRKVRWISNKIAPDLKGDR